MKRVLLAVMAIGLFSASNAQAFSLKSSQMNDGGTLASQQILNGFGCSGENLSPELTWDDVPQGTRSFAVTVYDPDAPTGSGWWHWVVFNIPADIRSLPVGAGSPDGKMLPQGAIQSRTDFGEPGFGGACPPEGDKPHRYQFTIHALDVEKLELVPDVSAAMVGFMLSAHTLEQAQLTVTYGR